MLLFEDTFVDALSNALSNIWFTWILIFKSRFFCQVKNIVCMNKYIMSPEFMSGALRSHKKTKFVRPCQSLAFEQGVESKTAPFLFTHEVMSNNRSK